MFDKDLKKDIDIRNNSSTDISNFKRLYRLQDGSYLESFSLDVLNRFKDALIASSDEITLDPKYYQRPDYFCHDTYGLKELWYIILFVNDVFERAEFTKEQIYVPSKQAIQNLLTNRIPDKEKVIQL